MYILNIIKKVKKNEDIFYKYGTLFLTCCIAFVSEYSISFNGKMLKILWMILAALGIIWNVILIKNKRNEKCNKVLYVSLIPYIILIVYTILLLLLRGDPLNIGVQAITTTVFIVVDLFMVSFLIMCYKEKAASIITYSIILGYIFGLLFGVKEIGLYNMFFNFFHHETYYFEKHDIGVAVVPLLLLYFNFFINKKKQLINKIDLKMILLFLILILCGKRSAYMGLIAGLIVSIILRKYKGNEKKIGFFLLLVGFMACFIYVVAISSGILNMVLGGTAFKDRLYVWTWFNDQYTFSPLYLGKGFQYIHRYMTLGLGDGMVNSFGYLHNSILQIYIEGGFIIFTIWFLITLFFVPLYIHRKHDKKTFFMYIILILSTITIYTVDNVLTYPIYIVSLFISLLTPTLVTDEE